MDFSPEDTGRYGDSTTLELASKIMVVSIIILFLVVVFVFCLHLYAKLFWYRNTTTTTRRRRRRLDFAPGHHGANAAVRRGLDPSILKTLAVTEFDPERFKDGLECAVCLCEVSEGEKTRILPKCSHGFHVECIDMWFQSHSTCPLCRNPVSNENVDVVGSSFPTNVLVWGNVDENHQSSSVIDIPEGSSSSLSSVGSTGDRRDEIAVIDIPRRVEEEEEKSPVVVSRLKSFKRLLSGNRMVKPSSPRSSDLESQS